MNILFFVIFPVSVILISIVLQKVLNSPLLVSILVFAVFLILSYTVYTTSFLLNAVVYAILAFITSEIIIIICYLIRRFNWNNCSGICNNANNGLQDSIDTLEDNINTLNELLSNLINNENNNGCGCNRRIRR